MEDKQSVVQILQEVVDEMCNKYCKYPDLWDESVEGIELCESDFCKNCPLNKVI